MSDGYDVQDVVVIQIDDRKWKTAKHEPAGSVQILGPALWRAHDLTDNIGHGCTKFGRIIGLRQRYHPIASLKSSLAPRVKAELPTSHLGIL
jgi:hypothetical protein